MGWRDGLAEQPACQTALGKVENQHYSKGVKSGNYDRQSGAVYGL